ncbi:Paraquat-inducible protein A [Denitrovibrio acetiphilus DSM 12809]|uniref:Paraquat-inducible protein A n=1 Tax=Denitrovibrio acetiphilus (strain DSM 12809 / NBRC 114555 / N2460) TaxID=522772 RepID=D4H237_DENA2|nr:paraquat-inducible protein A [Denitrovibrio acetiphilus]ADD67014.1 Paraquat-inducible protein A [Denitrovibrio acetiphilus DSM 12809]
MLNDIESKAFLCATCGTLVNEEGAEGAACPVCGSRLQRRKKHSLQRTWALTIASIILYFPANLLPVMDVQVMGDSTSNTILGGVIQFYQYDMYFICAVVFVASFVVPIFKMTVLLYLLTTLRKKSGLNNVQKTRLYYIVEHIGKWSMLDVFVVAIMSGLINTGYMLNITGGLGIVFFSAVVILTMWASGSFDTRLIWDKGD